ncbi:MAG: transcriptional repressor [Bacillota bacterium]|nr:transcriptional repressor [Bacillota bacterium]
MTRFENYGKFLEENNIRPSSQRILMLKYLKENHIHPTADKIFVDLSRKLPTISKATVYNNLKLFLNKGIIKEINLDNTEVHYEMVLEDHAHFVCRACGKIQDLNINSLNIDTTSIDGYEVDSQDIYLKGLCKDCIEKEKLKKN